MSHLKRRPNETECCSNYLVKVEAQNFSTLESAIELALLRHFSIWGWSKDTKDNSLVFYWFKQEDATPFPIPLVKSSELISLCEPYLEKTDPIDSAPNIDGSYARGFRLTCKESSGWSYEAFRVTPVWVLFHKFEIYYMKHTTVKLKKEVDVDEDIAPLIQLLWDNEIETRFSCQGNPKTKA